MIAILSESIIFLKLEFTSAIQSDSSNVESRRNRFFLCFIDHFRLNVIYITFSYLLVKNE